MSAPVPNDLQMSFRQSLLRIKLPGDPEIIQNARRLEVDFGKEDCEGNNLPHSVRTVRNLKPTTYENTQNHKLGRRCRGPVVHQRHSARFRR
jgi:hypothetical protein